MAARGLKGGAGVGDQLAGVVIYASLTEYLAENLLENLRQLVYYTTYIQYAGILFLDERNDESKRTLGQTVRELEKYYFPDRDEIIRLLKEITESRNNVFHNLAKVDQEKAMEIDADLKSIMENGEELINKIDVIYVGLGKMLLPAPEQTQADVSQEAAPIGPQGSSTTTKSV